MRRLNARVARKLRVEYPGALYHVINRGNYQHEVFASVGAAKAFEAVLGEACERHGWIVHAYAIMRNHFHLALETPAANLVEGMHWLQSTFATRFNRFRSKRGHMFQGRYQALLVEDAVALTRVVSYIHLNPVRAKIVSRSNVATFRWGSLIHFVKSQRWQWLRPEVFLAALELADTARGWSTYVEYLAILADDPTEQQRQGFDQFSRGWAIGTAGWRRTMAREHRHRAIEPGFEREALIDIKQTRWKDELHQGLVDLGKTREDLRCEGPTVLWKIELARRLRFNVAAPCRWIASTLRMTSPAAVRMHLYRCSKQVTA